MSKIYIVSAFSMEPYSDYGNWPDVAFSTKEAAEKYLEMHDGVYDEGYFKWDDEAETEIPCDKDDEDASYEYGWKYSSYIQEIELVDK